MKSKYKIILIIICVLFVVYVSTISSTLGPEDVFSPAGIVYFPSIVIQLIANEGNGIICVDACGPCSVWGHNYLLVDGECKIPDKLQDCYSISPPMEWIFVNGKCEPADDAIIYTEFQTVLDSCTYDSEKERMDNPLRYSNGTHVFLNLQCEWKRIGYFVVD